MEKASIEILIFTLAKLHCKLHMVLGLSLITLVLLMKHLIQSRPLGVASKTTILGYMHTRVLHIVTAPAAGYIIIAPVTSWPWCQALWELYQALCTTKAGSSLI